MPKIEITPKGIRIDGKLIPIATDAQAEEAGAVVCAATGTPTPWPDNVKANCAWCGADIIHRPTVPKKPPKICIPCAISTRQ